MKALIIASGSLVDYDLLKKLVQEQDFILCADGGIRHLMQINFLPNLVIGDLDSIDVKGLDFIKENSIEVYKFPKMKDETDTKLALNYLIENNYKEISILGAIGSRMDHSLGNIFLLRELQSKGIKGKIINENNIIQIVTNSIILDRKPNFFTSIIPITPSGIEITVEGFLYPLKNSFIEFGSTRGISNEIIEEYGVITINKGEALVIESID